MGMDLAMARSSAFHPPAKDSPRTWDCSTATFSSFTSARFQAKPSNGRTETPGASAGNITRPTELSSWERAAHSRWLADVPFKT